MLKIREEIIFKALSQIGLKPSCLSKDSLEYKEVEARLDSTILTLLQTNDWSFARKSAELIGTEVDDKGYVYNLPDDFLRFIEPLSPCYEIAGRQIYSRGATFGTPTKTDLESAKASAFEAEISALSAKDSASQSANSATNAANSAKELEINLEENHYTKTQTDLKLDNKLNVKKGSISVSEIKDIEAPSSQTDSRITFGRGIQLTATGNVAGEPQPSSSIKLHTSGGVEMTTPSGGLTLNGIKIPNENDVQETVDGAIGDFLDVENKAIKVDKISPLTPTNGDGVVITADNSLSGGQAVTKGSFSPLGFNFRWEDKRDILKKRYSEITSRENHMSMVQVSTFDERLAGGLSFDQGSASLFGDSIDIRAAYSLNIEAKVMTRYYYIEGQGGKYYGIIDQKLLDEALVLKQDKLKAGGNITISEDGTISSGLGLELQVVDTLPTTGVVGVLYLVPKGGSVNDTHDEYVWVDTKYELIGNTSVDLSAYYTKTQIDGIIVPINSKITTIETELPTKAPVALLATKMDKILIKDFSKEPSINFDYTGSSLILDITEHLNAGINVFTISNLQSDSDSHDTKFISAVKIPFIVRIRSGTDPEYLVYVGTNPHNYLKVGAWYQYSFDTNEFTEIPDGIETMYLEKKLIDIDRSIKVNKLKYEMVEVEDLTYHVAISDYPLKNYFILPISGSITVNLLNGLIGGQRGIAFECSGTLPLFVGPINWGEYAGATGDIIDPNYSFGAHKNIINLSLMFDGTWVCTSIIRLKAPVAP